MDDDYIEALRAFNGVKEEFLNAYLDKLVKQYGSLNDYLTDKLGLSEADLKALQDKYTM